MRKILKLIAVISLFVGVAFAVEMEFDPKKKYEEQSLEIKSFMIGGPKICYHKIYDSVSGGVESIEYTINTNVRPSDITGAEVLKNREEFDAYKKAKAVNEKLHTQYLENIKKRLASYQAILNDACVTAPEDWQMIEEPYKVNMPKTEDEILENWDKYFENLFQ